VFVEPTVLAARPKQEPPAIPPSAPPMPQADDRPAALKKLVQSLRRNELSPIGESRLYLKLMTEYVASIAELSTATGRTREQITRALRLLSLPDRQRDLIERGALSREQAYALLDAENSEAAANPASPGTIGRPQ
jgi:ParB/RepB/Spo0J family partition protein